MRQTVSYAIRELIPYINWVYFFHAWGFSRQHAETSETAEEANQLRREALTKLDEFDTKYRCYGCFALYAASADGDDLVIQTDEGRLRLPFLRQQQVAKAGDPYLCLSDFIRPQDLGEDKLGIFATTVDKALEQAAAKEDDYNRMLTQTLADRLAEATAEKLHEDIRKTFWGYAPDEAYAPEELLAEPYQGIRPATGYPSIPDQSIHFLLDAALHFAEIGIRLTENGAMLPHASVCGFVFAHPQACYFHLGKISEEQLTDYARRRGLPVATIRKFLAANL